MTDRIQQAIENITRLNDEWNGRERARCAGCPAVEALEIMVVGVLPDGDHVDGSTWEFARQALAKIK